MYFSKMSVTKVLHFAGNMQKKTPMHILKDYIAQAVKWAERNPNGHNLQMAGQKLQ